MFSAIAGGGIFAFLFFVLIFFAAVTSAIALLEVPVSFAIDTLKWSRKKAALGIGCAVFVIGIPSALSFGLLGQARILNYSVFDFIGMITDNILLPAGGLAMCYFVGWKWNPECLVEEIERGGVSFKVKKLWVICIRYLTPILVGIVTLTGFYSIYQVVF